MIVALMKAVDTHADLLRASVATAGNDHRLGANEAPPAIISIFLGEQLTDVIEQLEKGGASSSKAGGEIKVGVTSLPTLPRDATDRNRTSPFAFTGNKFEFRAVGSEQSCAGPNVVLNTIVTEALDEICTELDTAVAAGTKFNVALQALIIGLVKKHKRILFNGDNYTQAWVEEAARRGLPNLRKTPEALDAIVTDKAIKLFGKYKVLSEVEVRSRYAIYKTAYEEAVVIEARCAVTIARTQILPAVLTYQSDLAETINSVKAAGVQDVSPTLALLNEVCDLTGKLMAAIKHVEELEEGGKPLATLAGMAELRKYADTLEGLVADDLWPLPSYTEMLFMY